jgi:V/A-type H+-transporting ATPase subunit D
LLLDVHWAGIRYGLLATPHWVDGAIDFVRRIARQRLEITFGEERLRCLERAIRKAVQKVNLFQKVLIPTAEAEIRRIRVALADADRTAVVQSKIFKARHVRAESRL